MDLRCRKTNCKYNKELTCTIDKLCISSKLFCEGFKNDKSKEEIDFSKQIFTKNQPKIANYRDINDMNLNCKAKCLFNQNGKCVANGITINAFPSKNPKCITFMKP